ncbi:hypothetical protein ACXNSR_38675 [Streptomyces sp. NC-S4]
MPQEGDGDEAGRPPGSQGRDAAGAGSDPAPQRLEGQPAGSGVPDDGFVSRTRPSGNCASAAAGRSGHRSGASAPRRVRTGALPARGRHAVKSVECAMGCVPGLGGRFGLARTSLAAAHRGVAGEVTAMEARAVLPVHS